MLFYRSWISLSKKATLRFVPTVGKIRGNLHGSSMACWRVRCRIPIRANFLCQLPLRRYDWMLVEIVVFEEGSSTNIRVNDKGQPVTIFWASEKYIPWAITWHCLRDPTFTRVGIASCGWKNTTIRTESSTQTYSKCHLQLPWYLAEEIYVQNGRILKFDWLVPYNLTLDRVTLHTIVHRSSTSTYTPNVIVIETVADAHPILLPCRARLLKT